MTVCAKLINNTSEIVILAVCFQLKQLKKQPEKNSGLNGTQTHDLSSWLFFRLLFQLLKLKAHYFFNCLKHTA